MAESVDALVSNTSGATRAGSTPALGTSEYFAQGLNETEVLQSDDLQHFLFSLQHCRSYFFSKFIVLSIFYRIFAPFYILN